jgi:glycosyltransferase involved in cell wall biosynthesis
MKILILASNIPPTSRMPGSPRLFNLSRELSRNHEIVLASLCSSQDRYRDFLNDPTSRNVFKRVELLPDPPPATWLGQQWHRAHLAAHFETRYRHAGYHRAIMAKVRQICEQEKIDLIHADLLATAQYVDQRWNVPAIVDITDSLTLLYGRLLRAEKGVWKRLSVYLEMLSIRNLEQSLARSFDLIITNSSVDEEVIKHLNVASKTLTITNGVDMEFFSSQQRAIEPEKIVFTGVMGYSPNEDAALYFSEDIFPLIRAQRPKAQFWIVGSGASQRVTDLAHCPGIHVTGEVEDIRPFIQSAAVIVCPLRVGSGVKNKILVAMAMQKATVATLLSIEGLDVIDNEEVLLADDPRVFADKVLYLLAHPEDALRLGLNGLKRVQEQYSWAAMGKALEAAIQSVMDSRGNRRGIT